MEFGEVDKKSRCSHLQKNQDCDSRCYLLIYTSTNPWAKNGEDSQVWGGVIKGCKLRTKDMEIDKSYVICVEGYVEEAKRFTNVKPFKERIAQPEDIPEPIYNGELLGRHSFAWKGDSGMFR